MLTKAEHIEIHKELHKSLDLLIADFISCTEAGASGQGYTGQPIKVLLDWAYRQTLDPVLPFGEKHAGD